MPEVVTDASGQVVKARYSYLTDGTKLSVRDAQNDGLSYRGSFVYTVDGTAGSTGVTEKLESIAHDEGRFVALSASVGATTTQFIDTWHIRDYLGSVRTVLDITRDTSEVSDPTLEILEQNDYLPFGTRIDLNSLAYDQSNRYRFNGKEEQVTGSLGLIDYGARLYDCILPRWTTPDPLAEKYYSTSPYVFCNNNPVNFVDPDGRQIKFFEMAAYSGSIPNYAYSMPIYDYETGDYSITGYYDEEGNLVGYGAARNGRLEYVMDDADDINIFTSNLSLFGYAANCFYNNGTPSNGAIAMISGDFGYGLEQEWKSAATSVEYWVNLAGILISPFSSQKAEMNRLIAQSKRLYPKKANKIEYHHIDPMYMGGSRTGKKVPLVGSYHQMITNEFRKYHPFGKGKLPASERQKIMQQVYSKYPLP